MKTRIKSTTKQMMPFLFVLLILSATPQIRAQNFQNGDLEGNADSISLVPAGWQNVPYSDYNCQATGLPQATPDLTDINGPNPTAGILGNPCSGQSFVSGLFSGGSTAIWHEGIMQSVAGFTPGQFYTISFCQAVVKQSNGIDNSGSWAIYMDTTLISITSPTYSSTPFYSPWFTWDLRAVSFRAPGAGPFLFKFLPMDDDPNLVASLTDTTGSLRMGIDNIVLSSGAVGLNETAYSALSVYPNPCSGKFTVQTDGSTTSASIEVTDAFGQMILQYPVLNSVILVDLENYTAGVYFICLKDENGILSIIKVMKQ